MQEIEIEFKNMLTEKEYHQVKKYFSLKESDFFVHENEYFETATFALQKQHSALRIRKKADQYILTLKQPASEGLLETHQILSSEEVQSFRLNQQLPVGEVKTVLEKSAIMINELHSLGVLKTKRAEVPYQNGLIVLDHSFYLDTEDFELEYEVQQALEGKQAFITLLSELNIPIRPTKNKIVRFFEQKTLLNRGE